MKAFEIKKFGIDDLAISERETPSPGQGEVLVRFRAASLNYRDLMMVTGTYNPRLRMPIVPCSDGAGEVAEVGVGVTRWKVGDRVTPIFMQSWLDGPIEYGKARTTLGGDLDGTLREFGVFGEEGLVPVPDGFSFEEASTLPCAALTAFNALFESGSLSQGETVLIQGTGGVSIFALQFARAAGCETIVISSSAEKLERARALGATHLIDYREREDWDRAVLEVTNRRGVDHVVEVGGAGTLQRSAAAAKMGGHIAVIGVLSGKGTFDPTVVLMKALRLHGIFVGSRTMFERMNAFIGEHGIRPVIDREFAFEEARQAFLHLEGRKHFGKVVIRTG